MTAIKAALVTLFWAIIGIAYACYVNNGLLFDLGLFKRHYEFATEDAYEDCLIPPQNSSSGTVKIKCIKPKSP